MGTLTLLLSLFGGATAHPAAPAIKVASTYEEAACAEPANAAATTAEKSETTFNLLIIQENCTEPQAISCGQMGASEWVTEMIGACEAGAINGPVLMLGEAPKHAPKPELCDGISCQSDSSPLRSAGLEIYKLRPLVLNNCLTFSLPLVVRLTWESFIRSHQTDRNRLDRPPRFA